MSDTIEKLVKTIRSRKGSDIKSSYTALLLSKGNDHCLNKLKEEVAELEDAIKNEKNTVHETADVIYHLLVTLESAGINFDAIITELKKREGISGFEEKRNRQIWLMIKIIFLLRFWEVKFLVRKFMKMNMFFHLSMTAIIFFIDIIPIFYPKVHNLLLFIDLWKGLVQIPLIFSLHLQDQRTFHVLHS